MIVLQQIAPFIAFITFTLIQFRRDIPDLIKLTNRILNKTNLFKTILHLLFIALPYLLFCGTGLYLLNNQNKIRINYHCIKSISTDESFVNMEGKNQVDLFCSKEHFKIRISGVFYGPELRRIINKYNNVKPKVYAIVSEESRPVNRNVLFVQSNEFDTLDATGHYSINAYLGGKGIDSANQNEIYSVYIYIPEDQSKSFPIYAVYDQNERLPKPLYLSSPYYVRIKR